MCLCLWWLRRVVVGWWTHEWRADTAWGCVFNVVDFILDWFMFMYFENALGVDGMAGRG